MQIFLDSANLGEIKEANSWGVIDGITTNPTLIERNGKEFNIGFIKKITEIIDGPISVEVIQEDFIEMVKEARDLRAIHKNIVVKIPLTLEGLKVIKLLKKEGINTNATLNFSSNQALLAAKAGATYVSPFLGRLDDIGQSGLELVKEILLVFKNYNFSTKVIAASIRNPIHVKECSLMGCHISTIPFKVLKQLIKHPLTDIGIQNFLNDWKKVYKGENK